MVHEISHHTEHVVSTCIPKHKHFVALSMQYFDNRVLPFYWSGAKEFLSAVSASKIYHEGICSHTDGLKFIEAKADEKNPRALVVRELLDRGAVLVPTESIATLNADYLYTYAMDSIPKTTEEKEFIERLKSLKRNPNAFLHFLKKELKSRFDSAQIDLLEDLCDGEKEFNPGRLRDKYMAIVIDSTLSLDETAVLFVGRGHAVDKALAEIGRDIVVEKYISSFDEDVHREKFMKLINSRFSSKIPQLVSKRKAL